MPSHGYFVAILPVSMPIAPLIRQGPLQLQGEVGTAEEFTTDAETRRRYVADPFASTMLWGSTGYKSRFNNPDSQRCASQVTGSDQVPACRTQTLGQEPDFLDTAGAQRLV